MAGPGRRLLARLVDTVVVAVVGVAVGVPLVGSALEHLNQKIADAQTASARTGQRVQVWLVDPVTLGKLGALLALLLLFGAVYEVMPTARTGQTFGKRLARIRVVDASGGRPPTVGRSVARWLVGLLGTLLLVGAVVPLFDRTARRGWHDRAARTRVVVRK
ncbi:RDD family protein [Kitasatospora terrestris]|uniref:RDD domain-containing protein n=1 Tax=Kitasatospora terrestris TaxID=258051 RepID=A0ABP9DPQ1_9ACTN